MSKTNDDWMAKYEAEAKRQARGSKRLAAAKPHLLAALKAKRIASVTVEYDGSCDDGQIGEITATGRNGKPAALKGSILLDLDGDRCKHDLRDAVEEFTWELLLAYHAGFEINDGGYGTLNIDVAKGTITLDHNDRFTDVTNTLTEV